MPILPPTPLVERERREGEERSEGGREGEEGGRERRTGEKGGRGRRESGVK